MSMTTQPFSNATAYAQIAVMAATSSLDKLTVSSSSAATKQKSKPENKKIVKSDKNGAKAEAKKSKKKKTNKGNGRNYLKCYTLFKCTGLVCAKEWSSVHGWQEEPACCEHCGTIARETRRENEMCTFDIYVCPCGTQWECLHHPFRNSDECYRCGTRVERSGTQHRYGTHFWYMCRRCPGWVWEEATTGRVFSQRCRVCFNAGAIIGTRTESPEERDNRISQAKRGFRMVGVGTHDVGGCDMCQQLIRQGVASSCTRSRRIRVEEMGNGDCNVAILA